MAAPTGERTMQRPAVPRRERPKAWPWPLNLYQTTVGRKWLMAVSGIALLGFVVVHMLGNLKVYIGAEDTFHYAEGLRSLGSPYVPHTHLLWILRIGLIGAFALHILCAYSLNRRIRSSNPDAAVVSGQKKYAGGQEYVAANYASRTMQWTGPIILLYLFFHLADFTWGWFNPDFVRGDPYNNLVRSFERVPVALIYIVANVALAIHIFHGAWSMFQSLGINNPKYNALRRAFAAGVSGIILVGNVSFPIAVMLGILDETEPTYLEGAVSLLGRLV
jgi:succinate dehydrogenase cytochrome b subunit